MTEIMITRQPIYDRRERAAGYDIRFRPTTDGSDPLAVSLLNGSLEVISSGLPVWVGVSEAQVLNRVLTTPGNSAIVAMIPAAMEPTPEVLQGLEAMHAAGVVLAIEEFYPPLGADDPMHQLLALARYARIDARAHAAASFRAATQAAKAAGLLTVADLVFDRAAYTSCQQAGCDYFLGAHFSRPELLPSASLPTSTIAALQVLSLARDEKTTERDLEEAISNDPSVTFQLLRIVNSASIGGRGIESVGHALRLTGRNTLIRWLALATFASRADQSGVSAEITGQAVRRAYIAEGLAKLSTGRDPKTAFLVGLFSLIDAVFRIPMSEVVERINLASEVREALLDRTGPYADLLQFIECYELGQWESAVATAQEMGVDADAASGLYLTAVAESRALLSSAA